MSWQATLPVEDDRRLDSLRVESQKDLAGASIEFDIRQTAINDAT
ncbi:hypothetical protein [Bradyrhizobium liaoningense]|nr:hypothetical protein [Bradyrhizobium liaoningense]